ncbi:Mediator of RNA polymerase II transcription subunit 16 [Conoideocrella luteorostrata]|uniref:Mediator of RNA polymerase II transcription subunit 16 n=1 Tax=Conoideocrella luteorostrata TaxID=1105319 RepID=A0AAJ0CNG7_9HYPO|nr:Mediator of RNA polymerase II transcription subunit 16 [Conoideocrella luteorostrata]
MTAEKMPLILDNAIPMDLNNVDELFGDDVALQLPVRSQGKQLQLRLDELRNRGCCQTVVWSKSGTVASLSSDGQDLELRFLRCHPDNGIWDLSEPTTCDLVKGSPAIPLVHLEWGTTNSPELAVMDAAGRVAIVSFAISLNHPFITRKWEADAVDEFHAIAGCYWLPVAPSNQQKPFNVIYGPANKQGNGYSYETSLVHALGPCHPHPAKSALFCVTMNGMLKMYWSQNNNRMEETTMELESVNTSDELITHAAFSSDKKFLLAAIATSSSQLKLLKIEIQWGGPGSSSDKNAMPQNARLNPALVETHVASANWLCTGHNDANHDASITELSYVHVLPAVMDNSGSSTVPPLILTVRSKAAGEGSFQSAQSILDRWEAVESKQNLDLAFEQLGNRRNSVSSEPPSTTKLKRLEPVIINKIIISLQVIHFGKIIVLTMSDGSVEYRDRFTFEEIYANQDVNKLMTLRQAGWSFSDDGPCHQAALSPTCCSMVQIGDDGKVRLNKLQYAIGDIGNSIQDAHYSATIAGITIMAASAMFHQSNYDDLLAVVQPLASKKRFVQDWISELVRILKIQVDYTEETHYDTLMRNSPLQSCLSIMNSLGFKGESRKRTFQSKLAMLDLSLRNVVILITLASNTPTHIREKMNPLDEHEVVDALASCAKWSVDLLSWLVDSLFELMNDEEFRNRCVPQRFSELNAYLQDRNDVSLHLLLSSSSRSFLSAVCRRIGLLESTSGSTMDFYKTQGSGDAAPGGKAANPQLQQAYQKMRKATTANMINVAEFEKLLNVLGQEIRSAYSLYLPQMIKAQPNAPQGRQLDSVVKTTQVQFEVTMLVSNPPPPPFIPVINKLFTSYLPAFRKLTDPAKLFFADFELLGVQDDNDSLAARRTEGVYVDLFKRVELRRGSAGPRWRRCVRCASVMEDVFGSRPGYTFLLGQQRKCSCGGYWSLLPKGKLAL